MQIKLAPELGVYYGKLKLTIKYGYESRKDETGSLVTAFLLPIIQKNIELVLLSLREELIRWPIARTSETLDFSVLDPLSATASCG